MSGKKREEAVSRFRNEDRKESKQAAALASDYDQDELEKLIKKHSGQSTPDKRGRNYLNSDSENETSSARFKTRTFKRESSEPPAAPKKAGKKKKIETDSEVSGDESHQRSKCMMEAEEEIKRLRKMNQILSKKSKGNLKAQTVKITFDLNKKNKLLKKELDELKLSSEGSKGTSEEIKIFEVKVQKMKIEKENMKESLDEERDRSNRYRKQRNQAEDKIEKVKKDYNAVVKEVRILREQSKAKDDLVKQMKKDRDAEAIRNVAVKEEEEDNGGKKKETTVDNIEKKKKDGSYVKSAKEEDDTVVKYVGETSAGENSAEKKSAKVRSAEEMAAEEVTVGERFARIDEEVEKGDNKKSTREGSTEKKAAKVRSTEEMAAEEVTVGERFARMDEEVEKGDKKKSTREGSTEKKAAKEVSTGERSARKNNEEVEKRDNKKSTDQKSDEKKSAKEVSIGEKSAKKNGEEVEKRNDKKSTEERSAKMDEEVEKTDDKKSTREGSTEKKAAKEVSIEEELSKSPLLGKRKRTEMPPTQNISKATDDEVIGQFSSDEEFEAVHSFRVDDYIIKNVFNSKDSIANIARLPKKILKEHRKFTAVSLNNRVVYVVTNANAKHRHNPNKGSGTCGLSPVCTKKWKSEEQIGNVFIFDSISKPTNETYQWVCLHHFAASVEGANLQIQKAINEKGKNSVNKDAFQDLEKMKENMNKTKTK